ncbi:MAG: hypothetical protein ACAH95_02235 [Fimbriimonas sp.]
MANEVAGLWQTERAKGTYTVLAFCNDQKGFLLHVTEENDNHFGFEWQSDNGVIAIEWPESSETWPYLRIDSAHGERDELRIDFPGADSETFHYFGEAGESPALIQKLTRLTSPAAFSRWAWSLRPGDEGYVPSAFGEGAIVEICVNLVGSLFAGAALAKAVPASASLMFCLALLPFFCVAVFREHWKDSVHWWQLCPSIRRIGAFLYFAIGLLATIAAGRTNAFGYPAWEAALRTVTFGGFVFFCGWTMLREIQGVARARFEIIAL